MRTVSINVMSLCVPCENRCRYCLLSWDGKLLGADYERSRAYAQRFYDWIRKNRPDLSFAFYFGYAMEHPDLMNAIDFAREIGSPGGKFLQFDGMKFRSSQEIRKLLRDIQSHGVELIDLTFYGTQQYHDKFAGRKGDFAYMMEILRQANGIGLPVNVGVALTHENVEQADELIQELEAYALNRVFFFVPHAEGRGASLNPVRFCKIDFDILSDRVKSCFNSERFKTEGSWIRNGVFSVLEKRVLTVSLTPENIDFFETKKFEDTISLLEKMDDDYYRAIPAIEELAKIYGDPDGEEYYSERDLCLRYQRRYIAEHRLEVYDVNDERQCFSRRF